MSTFTLPHHNDPLIQRLLENCIPKKHRQKSKEDTLTLLQLTIHQRIKDLFYLYTDTHSKTLVIRFDIRYPRDYTGVPNNRHISKCLDRCFRKYRRRKLDPYYFWVREFSDLSPHPHYHCFLLLNGQRVRKYKHVFTRIEHFWSKILKCPTVGCISHCLPDPPKIHLGRYLNGSLLRHDNWEFYLHHREDLLSQLLYLAKSYSKVIDKDNQRNFGGSNLTPLMRKYAKKISEIRQTWITPTLDQGDSDSSS